MGNKTKIPSGFTAGAVIGVVLLALFSGAIIAALVGLVVAFFAMGAWNEFAVLIWPSLPEIGYWAAFYVVFVLTYLVNLLRQPFRLNE